MASWLVIAGTVLVVLVLALVALLVFAQSASSPKKKDEDGSKESASAADTASKEGATPATATPSVNDDERSSREGLRRRPSASVRDGSPSQPTQNLSLDTGSLLAESRRPSFKTNSPAVSPTAGRRSNLQFEGRSSSFNGGSFARAEKTSPTSPTSPKAFKKTGSSKGVSFVFDQSSSSPPSQPVSTLGLPTIAAVEEIECRVDAAETAVFSEDGLFVLGGGPEDHIVRLFNKGVGTIGSVRFNINLEKDVGKHDAPSALGFVIDEGKKATLLLIGTRSERFLLGYKISRSPSVAPLLVFAFETKHGSALAGVAGFVPKDATSYFDPGVFFATCGKGTREMKLWSGKGVPLASIDCECWTMGLRVSPMGTFLAVLSSGGGPGVVIDVKKDRHSNLKFNRSKLNLPIEDSSSATSSSPQTGSSSSGSSRRSAMGDLAYQAAQDLAIHEDGSATFVCCRVDLHVVIAQIPNVVKCLSNPSMTLETLIKPESLTLATPTHVTTVLPISEDRKTHVLVSRGKHLFFFDAAMNLIGVLEGRREDGDVLSVALSPKYDFAVVVSFGASVARIVNIV